MYDNNVETKDLSMDELRELTLNRERSAEVTANQLLLPAGWYQTNPEKYSELPKSVYRDKNTNRVVINIAAVLANPKTGTTHRVPFWLSPEYAPHKTREGEADHKYTLWVMAENAYRRAIEDEAEPDAGAVVEFLTKYPVRLNLIQVGVWTKRNPNPSGNPANIVMAIEPARG